jgi:HEAT repeat protein
MKMNDLRLILVGIIIIVSCFILASVLASVIRRVQNKKRYEKMDGLRDEYRAAILKIVNSGSAADARKFARKNIKPGSLEWAALEQVLFKLGEEEGQRDHARKLFDAFGYRQHYLNQLAKRGSSISLSSIADKLGRIGDPSAVEPVSRLLKHKKSEVVTVAFRALCRIGTDDALQRVLSILPLLLKQRRVTIKAVQTSLLLFRSWAGNRLLQYAHETSEPEVLAVILETLASFPPRREILNLALAGLSHSDPEVRGKALKVLARGEQGTFLADGKIFMPLLRDPFWFVRLQAAKTIGKLRCANYIEMLKKLAIDERWQVRDAATMALLNSGEVSLDAIIELLESPDRYARESISEEIQRTGFVLNLIEYLGSADYLKKSKARRILTSMHGVGFSTPLREAAESGSSGPIITAELLDILYPGISYEKVADRRYN